jgi:hypothetical protein
VAVQLRRVRHAWDEGASDMHGTMVTIHPGPSFLSSTSLQLLFETIEIE